MAEHRTKVIPDLNVRGTHTAVCSCGRMFGDTSKGEADREAREHEEGIEQAWVMAKGELEPWHPGKHPTPGYPSWRRP